jgi:hypothetical protein
VLVRNDEAAGWVAVRYHNEGSVLEAVFNLSAEPRMVPLESDEKWSIALSTDAAAYGGPGEAGLAGRELRLPGHTAALLRRVPA